jgi:hypothetical protein
MAAKLSGALSIIQENILTNLYFILCAEWIRWEAFQPGNSQQASYFITTGQNPRQKVFECGKLPTHCTVPQTEGTAGNLELQLSKSVLTF